MWVTNRIGGIPSVPRIEVFHFSEGISQLRIVVTISIMYLWMVFPLFDSFLLFPYSYSLELLPKWTACSKPLTYTLPWGKHKLRQFFTLIFPNCNSAHLSQVKIIQILLWCWPILYSSNVSQNPFLFLTTLNDL